MSDIRVLAYLHTFNDADVIETTIQALCNQSYPIPEILLVDNASSDNTLSRAFPSKVTIIRNDRNLGTSGAVAVGMKYALDHGYDWIYILDADSLPETDAVANLIRCYNDLGPELQASTWWLSSLLREANGPVVHHGGVFTPRGIEAVDPPREPLHYQCHTNMWSGSFYRLEVVRKVGLPDFNYVLDWGDMIYGYEGWMRGYIGFLDQSSVVRHNLHPVATQYSRRLGTRFVKLFHSPPIRMYYFWRNSMYFWLHRYEGKNRGKLLLAHLFLLLKWLVKVALFANSPGPTIRVCLRGMWDGLHGRLENRY